MTPASPHRRRAQTTRVQHVKRTEFGYPSVGARLGMRQSKAFVGRDRVIGTRLTHNGSLGYIDHGRYRGNRRRRSQRTELRHFIPRILALVLIVVALAALGYAVQAGWNPFAPKPAATVSVTKPVVDGAATRLVMPVNHAQSRAKALFSAQRGEDGESL